MTQRHTQKDYKEGNLRNLNKKQKRTPGETCTQKLIP